MAGQEEAGAAAGGSLGKLSVLPFLNTELSTEEEGSTVRDTGSGAAPQSSLATPSFLQPGKNITSSPAASMTVHSFLQACMYPVLRPESQ